jgi:hypothetical protein
MKQLSIYCSHDLEDQVVEALDRGGVDGFLRVAHATGNKFKPGDELPRVMTWDAALYLVPTVQPDRAEMIVSELQQFAGACEENPCLRIVVSTVERVI